MLKNGFQLTMRVYRVITFLFPLIRVKLSADFEFSYDQLDPVSLNSALWTAWIFALNFLFRMKQIVHCSGTGDRKYSGNPHKKWRVTTRKKSLSTSFKRALFKLSVVWLESLINCSNVLKPSTLTRFLSLLQFMVQGFPTQFLIGRSSQKILK